jgi:hypothetical protein
MFQKTMAYSLVLWIVINAPAVAQYNGKRASPGNCQVAIVEAQRNDDEWNAPFSMDECKSIAAKMIDDGMRMIEKSQEPDDGDERPRRRRH